MLKLLSQIMATILAVGVSFLAAYIIYLFSMKSDAISKIEKEGYIISSILEKYSSQLFFAFSDVGNKVMAPYLITNPKATKLDLIDLILKDLTNLVAIGEQQKAHKLFSTYVDDGMPYAGRIYVYSLDQYFQALFPPGVQKRSISYSYPYRYNKTEEQSKWLFPYGPNRMNEWLSEYERIKSAVLSSKIMLKYCYNDIGKYAGLNQDKSFIKRNNYQQWIMESIRDIEKINEPVRRIHSLIKIIDIYSIDKRLPNLHLISVFFILAFFCGVFLPLLIEGLGINVKENVPMNLSVLFTTVLFTFLAGHYLFKDLMPQKETIPTIVALSELHGTIDQIGLDVHEIKVVRYANINTQLKGVYKENLPKVYREKLDTLSNRLSDYNNSIQTVRELIKSNIVADEMLSLYATEEKGANGVFITNILLNDDFAGFFQKGSIRTIYLGGDDSSQNKLKLQVPKNEYEYLKFIKIIDDLKSELMKYRELKRIKEILELIEELRLSIQNDIQ